MKPLLEHRAGADEAALRDLEEVERLGVVRFIGTGRYRSHADCLLRLHRLLPPLRPH